MNDDQRIYMLGIFATGAVYVAGAIAAGLVTSNALAWKPALASAGISFFAYAFEVAGSRRPAWACAATSQVLGIFAGLALLFG